MRLKPHHHVHVGPQYLLRRGGRHLFDVHAACLAGHDHRSAGRAVDHHSKVELLGNLGRLFHHYLVYRHSVRSRLVSDQTLAQQPLGNFLGLLGRTDHLHAARQSSSAGVDLGLHHRLFAHLSGYPAGFLGGGGHPTLGYRYPELREYRLGLILVDFHKLLPGLIDSKARMRRAHPSASAHHHSRNRSLVSSAKGAETVAERPVLKIVWNHWTNFIDIG